MRSVWIYTLAYLVILGGATPAESSNHLKVGGQAKVTAMFGACLEKEELAKARNLLASGDKQAVINFIDRRFPSCRYFTSGSIVYIESLSVWSNAACLRERGDPDCYWFPLTALEPL